MNNPTNGPPSFDRDREQRELEEQHRQRSIQLQQQQEELAQREREQNERQERERQHREHYQAAPPHQNNTGSIPIHQPVASRLPTAIHSPGGLLATHGGAPPPPLGAPSGPGNAFGGPLHTEAARPIQHNPPGSSGQHQVFGPTILNHNSSMSNILGGPNFNPGQPQQQQAQQQQQQDAAARLMPFGGPITPGHQIPGAQALGQGGQQPILNVSQTLCKSVFNTFKVCAASRSPASPASPPFFSLLWTIPCSRGGLPRQAVEVLQPCS